MRRLPAVSVPRFALTAVICMLGGAAGCGRETWDLLAAGGAAGAVSGAAGVSDAGAGAGGAGGFTPGGGAGTAGGGRFGFAGAGGRPSYPSDAGNGGTGPCSSASPCPDFGCQPSVPFCTACTMPKDCGDEAPFCDPSVGRCYQCRQKEDCAAGEACFAAKCVTPCKDNNDCDGDAMHRICNTGIKVCVSCIYNSDCSFFNNGSSNGDYRCYQGSCVECLDDRECPMQACLAGHCQKAH